MSNVYRVLLIEDCVEDAFFNVRMLGRAGMEVKSERVDTLTQLQNALATKTWDFVLCDHRLPGLNGFAALKLFKDSGLDIPFIMVSGQIGEEQAAKLMKAGAHDYVMKDNLEALFPAVKRELRAAEERRARQRTHDTEIFLASIVRDCNDAIFGTTLGGSLVSWNKGAEKLYGYSASEIVGAPATILEPPDQLPKQSDALQKLRSGESVPQFETVHLRKNRTPVTVCLTMSPVRENSGRVIGASTLAHDASLRKQHEDERLELIRELADALAQTRRLSDSATGAVEGASAHSGRT